MASAASLPKPTADVAIAETEPRHPAFVRVSHWLVTLCFLALLVSGLEILISHPRFYWGEQGTVRSPALFTLPIPASRAAVLTGYDFVLPDQNGWSRSMHFQFAWILVFAGVSYTVCGLLSGHLRARLVPSRSDLTWANLSKLLASELRLRPGGLGEGRSYNTLQRFSYLVVAFLLFPLLIWTGLAMSPAIVSVTPPLVEVFGGRQSARTIHFIVSTLLVAFVLVHVLMVWRAGFKSRTMAMVTGATEPEGDPR